jgi:hypothetical protein
LDLLACFLPEHRAITRTHTFVPNGRVCRRSGLLPIRRSYGDMGAGFFEGVRLHVQDGEHPELLWEAIGDQHVATERALGGFILLRGPVPHLPRLLEAASPLCCVPWATPLSQRRSSPAGRRLPVYCRRHSIQTTVAALYKDIEKIELYVRLHNLAIYPRRRRLPDAWGLLPHNRIDLYVPFSTLEIAATHCNLCSMQSHCLGLPRLPV